MISKRDAKMSQGLAILSMVMLHLFCRDDTSLYNVHLFAGGVPLLYYIALFGDICVPIYCFSSGYAQYVLVNREGNSYRISRLKRLFSFVCHYWIVVCIFSVIGSVAGDADIPGNIQTFVGNLFLFRQTYNGAWWFVITYIFLILLSPLAIKAVDHTKPPITVLCSGVVYVLSYVLYYVWPISVEGYIQSWILEQLLLLGRCQFPFVIGMEFCNLKVMDYMRRILNSNVKRKCFIVIIPLACFLFHCVIQSMFVAPFTATMTLISFHLWDKPLWLEKTLLFFGKYSTNIWLTHMFFYLTLFKGFVFAFKEPILIYVVMLLICIAISYAINYVEKAVKCGLSMAVQFIKRR